VKDDTRAAQQLENNCSFVEGEVVIKHQRPSALRNFRGDITLTTSELTIQLADLQDLLLKIGTITHARQNDLAAIEQSLSQPSSDRRIR
jgi:hypothetical protein